MALNFQRVITYTLTENHPYCKGDNTTEITKRKSFGSFPNAIIDTAIQIDSDTINTVHVDIINKTTGKTVWSWDKSGQ